MSVLDKLKGLLQGREDQARQGVDTAGDAFEAGPGGESRADEAAQRRLDELLGNRPPTDDQP
ncbi:antitoxin [Streptomyces orinoci]|uniref:Antitoxin n=1 Tax=Streptomyces orinoci TaxID=67339 RepID=A0ABV3JU28_STRON|nr:antitoxin [Streptomyces orinoci]